VPVLEREEGRGTDRRGGPRRDEDRLSPDAVRQITRGEEARRGDEVADAEDETDVLRRRAEIAEEQRPDRRQEAEADAPKDLRAGEQPDVA
jgi:Cdc6-like AAA superfamily ATPase